MTTKKCGCSTETCGCCEGIEKLTPVPTANRPGLDALMYRVGTHGQFFETMKARLATMTVQGPRADGQTLETFQPLTGLTTRDPSDPAIALLDGWATVGDVLTFYQERIANEGYLRTATERRSVLELARLVGYTLRPGVASTVFLAYTLDEKQAEPVEIPVGSRAQSIPGPDELPQPFEAAEKLVARSAWNNLQIRLTRPPRITLGNVVSQESFYAAGTNTNLKKGDTLLFVFGSDTGERIIRTVADVEGQFVESRTLIRLAPLPTGTAESLPALIKFIADAKALAPTDTSGEAQNLIRRAEEILNGTNLGLPTPPPLRWAEQIEEASSDNPSEALLQLVATLDQQVKQAVAEASQSKDIPTTSPDDFVNKLLLEQKEQPANSQRLHRTLLGALNKGSDAQAQLLVNLVPKLKDSYYTAWQNAQVTNAQSPLKAVYVMRVRAALFGASAPGIPTFRTSNGTTTVGSGEHSLASDEEADSLFLDNAYEAILPASLAIIQRQQTASFNAKLTVLQRQVLGVKDVSTASRSAYRVTGKSTKLTFDEDWRPEVNDSEGRPDLSPYRSTLVYAQSEPLTVLEAPILDAVTGQELELARLYDGFTSGRWVILSGERADIPEVNGVRTAELIMVSGLRQDYDPTLPGDKTHTTLLLATPAAFTYKRETLTIYGNVVRATHGETRNETLGAGDGSQALQSFVLKQPPVTFVPAPTPAGVESTLHVYVNEVEWHETDTLAGLGPKDRSFVTKTDDKDAVTVVFGNGKEGSRLPTGLENVKAVYRSGIGKPGNVKAGQITLLQTKPLGVKEVINPLRASGGADKENRDQARENAPIAVQALDRLVGLADYSDFSRTFAGIAKADARRLSDGKQQIVHITIAGADDIPIDPISDLYRNLLAALRKFGDEGLPVRVESRELVVLVMSANIGLLPDYQWEPVSLAVRTALLDSFGFQKRALGQPALLCEVIGLIQSVKGVAFVDVDAFGGIPEKKAAVDDNGKPIRRLLTLDEMAQTVRRIVNPREFKESDSNALADRVLVNVAGFEKGTLHPAQLAILTPAVPDTLILNQII